MFKKVYSTKINVAATFASSIWLATLNIIFVPVYLNYIGIETYGLIGVFSSIQAFVALLDFGLSPTLNRELARLSALKDKNQEMQDIKRTLEIPNWIGAVFIALLLSAVAPLISSFWLNPKELSVETVTAAMIIIGINIAIQFSVNFYTGGLLGLQKQFLLSLISLICGTLRVVGAFAVLVTVSQTIQAFLIWQGLVAVLQVSLLALALRKCLPKSPHKVGFRKDLLSNIWKFAAGITGLTVFDLILVQTDKVILSRLLNLETFGYYILATTISTLAINMIAGSISQAVYPKFSRLVSIQDEKGLRDLYHRSCQIMSVMLLPVMVIFVLFSYDILLVWTGKENVALNTYKLLSLVAVGYGLHGLVWLPHCLQLAHGWTKLALYSNITAIIFLIPVMIVGVLRYDAIGGAVVWVILNILYILTVQIMHRRILKGDALKWYVEDLAVPLITATTVAGIGKMLLPAFQRTRLEGILYLSLISGATLFFTAFSTRATRQHLFDTGDKIFGYRKVLNK